MKLLFLTHYFPPEGNAPATRTWEHCRRWAAAGDEITVVTGVPNVPAGVIYNGYRNPLFATEEEMDGMRVLRVRTFIAANAGTAKRIANFLSFMVSATLRALFLAKPDAVIATSPQFFCGWAGVLVAKLRRVPLVLEIRDLWPESIVTVGAMRKGVVIRLLEWLEQRMYRAADRIVTVGEGYRQQLIERGVQAELIEVVPNGADLDVFVPERKSRQVQERYQVPEDVFTVAFVGTIGMASGLDCVVDAAEKMAAKRAARPVRFLLVGDGAERQRLETEVRRRKLDNVIFTGLVDKVCVREILSFADACLVHLRRADLFETVLPSKMFEAFAMQRPVILGLDGEARKLMEEADAGVAIPPEDSDALMRAIELLADDPGLCDRLGKNGRRFVRERFSRDQLAEEYRAILDGYDPAPRASASRSRRMVGEPDTMALPPESIV